MDVGEPLTAVSASKDGSYLAVGGGSGKPAACIGRHSVSLSSSSVSNRRVHRVRGRSVIWAPGRVYVFSASQLVQPASILDGELAAPVRTVAFQVGRPL